jgi:hypothetical protein
MQDQEHNQDIQQHEQAPHGDDKPLEFPHPPPHRAIAALYPHSTASAIRAATTRSGDHACRTVGMGVAGGPTPEPPASVTAPRNAGSNTPTGPEPCPRAGRSRSTTIAPMGVRRTAMPMSTERRTMHAHCGPDRRRSVRSSPEDGRVRRGSTPPLPLLSLCHAANRWLAQPYMYILHTETMPEHMPPGTRQHCRIAQY